MNKIILSLSFLLVLQYATAQKHALFPTLQQGLTASIGSQINAGGIDGNFNIGYFASVKLRNRWLLFLAPNWEGYKNDYFQGINWNGPDDQKYYRRQGWLAYQGWNINVPILISYHFSEKTPLFLAVGANYVVPIFSKANWKYNLTSRDDYNTTIEQFIEQNQEEAFATTRIHTDVMVQLGFQFPRLRWAISYTTGESYFASGENSFFVEQYNVSLTAYYRLCSADKL